MHILRWPMGVTVQTTLVQIRTYGTNINSHGTNENFTAQTKNFTAKTKLSRRKWFRGGSYTVTSAFTQAVTQSLEKWPNLLNPVLSWEKKKRIAKRLWVQRNYFASTEDAYHGNEPQHLETTNQKLRSLETTTRLQHRFIDDVRYYQQ